MNIGIPGYTGRIGTHLVGELQSGNWPDLKLAGGSSRSKPAEDTGFFVGSAEDIFERSDAVVDFTLPGAIPEHTRLAAAHNTALVIGTSGLSEEHERLVSEAARAVPVVYAANMSVGVNMLFNLTEQAARRLDGERWDAEIIDIHHRFKVDAPSGTSHALAKSIQKGRGEDAPLTYAREGHTGPREQGSIGFSVQRGGNDVIENTVIYFGDGERLELTHRATDRGIFARGALKAALWLEGKTPGLYSMDDVLEL